MASVAHRLDYPWSHFTGPSPDVLSRNPSRGPALTELAWEVGDRPKLQGLRGQARL